MGRLVRDWKPIKVSDLPVASHRYTEDGVIDADGRPLEDIEYAADWREALKCIAYKEGEVIYVQDGNGFRRALIYLASFERNLLGERREYYKVQLETKAGLFSKVWERTYPGFVQRGYRNAGMK